MCFKPKTQQNINKLRTKLSTKQILVFIATKVHQPTLTFTIFSYVQAK